MVVVAGWSRIEQPAAAPVPRAETARAARRPTRPASAPRRTPTGVERPLGLAVESAAPPTPPWSGRAELHIIGAGFGVLVMWALRGGATAAMPGRAAALPASAPNWRQAESNLERAPQVGVNLESTSASWSQPGVALKTWSQHLKPGASSLQLERARSNWSELAPSWSEVGASGASEKSFSNVGPLMVRLHMVSRNHGRCFGHPPPRRCGSHMRSCCTPGVK